MISNIRKVLDAFIKRRIRTRIDLISFEFRKLPLKKAANWFLTESSLLIKPSRPFGYPTILQIEPSSHCNLHCYACPVSTGLGRLQGHMDLSLFKKLIDQLGDYLLLILFWDWGEPFLNPHAYEMIRYARKSGIKVMSSTNGHVFATGDHAKKVVDSGLDVLVFSVDGITQKTYEKYRASGDLDSVLQGIKNVVAQKKQKNADTPIVNLRYIVMKHGEKEFPHLKAFARSLGVDVLTFRKFFAVTDAMHKEKAMGRQFISREAEHQLPLLSPSSQKPVRVENNPCKHLWNCPSIHWDGNVCSCFFDFSGRHSLGSVTTQRFQEIWFGEAYKDLRRNFRTSWKALPLCGKCSYGFKGGDIGKHIVSEAVFFPNHHIDR